ncbi:amidohydrolase [Subtercola sp. YIM 133946]|uniref:amidohydrolase n=1 Tax=Subtercola sp. YIM 133946 TaxID=3118909 RepID=UPI002F955F35
MSDLVITGATVLLHTAAGEVEFVSGKTLVIAGGVFTVVDDADSPDARAAVEAAIRAGGEAAGALIDAAGMVAMPGFINCHTHSPMVMFRGAAEDVPESRWFNEFIWPMEVNLTDEDVEIAAWLATAEMIRSGVTTFADHYFSMPSIAKVVDGSGLRAVLGATYFSSDGAAGLAQSLGFALEYREASGGRITTALAPHATYTVNDADLAATSAAALEHDLLVHIHASEDRHQMKHSRERFGHTPIETLRRAGMLETRLLIAHGIGIVAEDLPLLAAGSGRIGFGSAPRGYLKNGFDTTPVRLIDSFGIPVGLATDGAASNNTLDVWEAMTFMNLTQKARENDQTYMTSRQVLGHATTKSAAAVQLGDTIGSIAPGRKADLILVDLSDPRSQPVHDYANTIVHSARSSDVDTTIVDGRVLMRHKKILTIDVPAVIAELAPRLARLTDRSHGTSIQDYDA